MKLPIPRPSNAPLQPASISLTLVLAFGAAAAFFLGRASAGDPTPVYKPQILSLASTLAKTPFPKDAPFQITPLFQGQDLSVTTVRARKALAPHYHESREEVVYVVRGGGTMQIGEEKRPIKAGDLLYLPRGVVHGFTNGSNGDTVVVSVMAPPFDGQDRHFIEKPGN